MKKIFSILIIILLSSCSHKKEETTMNTFDSKTSYEISKIFLISPEKLFNALIDSTILKKIWGVQSINVDARVGGEGKAIYIEGEQDWSFTMTYQEIIKNEKLKWITHFKSFPTKETRVTLFIKKTDAGSELIVRMENFESEEERNANKGAWEKGLITLENLLK